MTRYRIEQFFCEFKLNKNRLKQLILLYNSSIRNEERNDYSNEFIQLYPESNGIENYLNCPDDIPATIIKSLYFVQSIHTTELPQVHYSLKEILLSEFRIKRSQAKKQMSDAFKSGDKLNGIRFNAKQNAIKIICNSEYGSSGNPTFAHYDPDIAAAITYASRQLISFLTYILSSNRIIVNSNFMRANNNDIKFLYSNNLIQFERTSNGSYPNKSMRRNSIGKFYEEKYYGSKSTPDFKKCSYDDAMNTEVISIIVPPSTIIYQDTDSNYYKNQTIIDSIIKNDEISPELVDKVMRLSLAHNRIIANFIKLSINRYPIGPSFEGSFLICRYLNRKKKYYGIKWSTDGNDIPLFKLHPRAYENGILKEHYNKYWRPKCSILPMEDGSYIKLNIDKLTQPRTNYLDYVSEYNVKCTGIDLARRDQYPFINISHIIVLKNDLRFMKYENRKWIQIKDNSMTNVVKFIINDFIKNLSWDGTIEYRMTLFCKEVTYKKDKKNTAYGIVNRLIQQNKKRFIPNFEEKLLYVNIDNVAKYEIDQLTVDDETKLRNSYKNVKDSHNKYLLVEILEYMIKKYPEYFINTETETLSNENAVEFLNNTCFMIEKAEPKMLSLLDREYYIKALIKSLTSYMISDYYPNECAIINNGELSEEEVKNLIDKLSKEIVSKFMKEIYNKTRKVSINKNTKNKLIGDINFEHDFKTLIKKDVGSLTEYDYKEILRELITRRYKNNSYINMLEDIRSAVMNDCPNILNEYHRKVMREINCDSDRLQDLIKDYIINNEKIDRYVEHIKNNVKFSTY